MGFSVVDGGGVHCTNACWSPPEAVTLVGAASDPGGTGAEPPTANRPRNAPLPCVLSACSANVSLPSGALDEIETLDSVIVVLVTDIDVHAMCWVLDRSLSRETEAVTSDGKLSPEMTSVCPGEPAG